MKYKNIWKRVLCVLLAVCSILSGINFNRMETKARVNEKKLYMDYLAKTDKKWRKKMEQRYPQRNPSTFKGWVKYKILDLDDDGRKELVYTANDWIGTNCPDGRTQLFACTIKKGKVHKIKIPEFHSWILCFWKLKGKEEKWVIGGGLSQNGAYCVIGTFSSEKMNIERRCYIDCSGSEDDWYFYDEKGKKIRMKNIIGSNKFELIDIIMEQYE